METKKLQTEVEIYIAKDGRRFDDRTECIIYDGQLESLYEETFRVLEQNGKHIDDIEFIVCEGQLIPLDKFFDAIIDLWYDNGYGGIEINETLMIVGKDWWLEREEYDGSEWWEYKELPAKTNLKEKDISKNQIKQLISQHKHYWLNSLKGE